MAKPLTRIFGHSWFERVWTVQEGLLAKDPYILIAGHRISLFALLSGCSVLRWWSGALGFPAHLDGINQAYITSRIWRHAALIQAIQNSPDLDSDSSKIRDWRAADSFRTLRGLKTRYGIDQIYGFHAVFSKSGLALSPPDVTKPCQEVYTEAITAALLYDNSLLPLIYLCGVQQQVNLPSWVPDWSIDSSLVPFDKIDSKDKASLSSPAVFKFSDEGQRLTLEGVVVDTITDILRETFEPYLTRRDHLLVYDEVPELFASMRTFNHWVQFGYNFKGGSCTQTFKQSLFNILLGWSEDVTETSRSKLGQMINITAEIICPKSLHLSTQLGIYQIFSNSVNKLWRYLQKKTLEKAATNFLAKEQFSHLGDIYTKEEVGQFVTLYTLKVLKFSCQKAQRMSARFPFFTQSRLFGVAPAAIKEGDQVALISGFPRPMIIRPDGIYWKLIGPAQIPGLMRGEKWPATGQDLNTFECI